MLNWHQILDLVGAPLGADRTDDLKTMLNGAKDTLAASDRVADEIQLHDGNPAVVLLNGKELRSNDAGWQR
jgi:hypothetical protein